MVFGGLLAHDVLSDKRQCIGFYYGSLDFWWDARCYFSRYFSGLPEVIRHRQRLNQTTLFYDFRKCM